MNTKHFKYYLVSSICGFSSIFIYLLLAIISWYIYPNTFNPIQNWLSDLAHQGLNPAGSIYYRLAGILPGILIILFYLFIYKIIEDNRKKFEVYTWFVRIFGIIAGFSFFMTGIFPINDLAIHSLWSKIMFISFGTSIIFTGIIWLYKKATKILSVVAFITAIVDISSSFLNKVYLLEWILVSLIIIYITIVSVRNIMLFSRNGNQMIINQ
jgi:hypothetical protein